MENEGKKAKRIVIGLFVFCLCIALACFGIVAYIAATTRGTELATERLVTISKIIVLTGIFFLVVAFGHLLPSLIPRKKRGTDGEEPDILEELHDIFDETNMRRALGKYIPDGETLLACIHAISKESSVRCVFGKCFYTEEGLIPHENGGIIAIKKEKYATYDVYLGITQFFLVITQCRKNKYYYEIENRPDANASDVREVTSEILLADIGTCFPLADIQSCEIKKGWMGSVKCFITMKNGSYFKLMFPKLGGPGGDMPHHTQYREAIIARLGGRNLA